MATNPLPAPAFDELLPTLVGVLELAQQHDGLATLAGKQALLHATSEFKGTLARARELAGALPGGELLIEEQDEIIALLERLRDRKRQQLEEFSERVVSTTRAPQAALPKMDVDSAASTPALS